MIIQRPQQGTSPSICACEVTLKPKEEIRSYRLPKMGANASLYFDTVSTVQSTQTAARASRD